MSADHKFNPGEGRVVRFEGACRNCGGTRDEHKNAPPRVQTTSDGHLVNRKTTLVKQTKENKGYVGQINTSRLLD